MQSESQKMRSSIFFCLFSFLLNTIIISFSLPGNVTDERALLSLKANIITDPLQSIASWNESTHFCNWEGITCGRKHQRVVAINLQSTKIGGALSPSVGNLSFLRELWLNNNTLAGIIPREIGRLTRLQELDLGLNIFSGEIPNNLSNCVNLKTLSLWNNNLTGAFPLEFSSLSKLEILAVARNNLVGKIPAYMGNFSSLEELYIYENHFEGVIPTSFARLQKLSTLSLNSNNLTSTIPTSIFNISSLAVFDVQQNQLEGYLPSNIGSTLPNLELLNIRCNLFIGRLPISMSNATDLWLFDVVDNGFTGGAPTFSGLNQLEILGLGQNSLGNGKSTDLDFLSSLLNSTARLGILLLHDSNFGGILPRYIWNFSELVALSLHGNVIHGYLPSEFHLLENLEFLSLTQNQLSGIIPSSLGSLQFLQTLYLDSNKLSGEIPSSLGNMSRLSNLYLQFNNLQGRIPISLEKSKNLLELSLAGNKLIGYLPKNIFSPPSSLVNIDLSCNHFTGPLPLEISGLKNLVSLSLSNNMLSGALPASLGALSSLVELDLSRNSFQGFIPPSFSSLKSLETLDVSSNNLTGKIPEFLGKLEYLKCLNLSFNHLEGEIPTQGIFFKNMTGVELGGNNLCGGIPHFRLPKCRKEGERQHQFLIQMLVIFIPSVASVLKVLELIFKQKQKQSLKLDATIELVPKLSYWSIQKATEGFSESNIIGSGKFSTVYRGVLDDGTIVAVKVINLHVRGASKSFLAECKALRQIRHRNLVKILTSCCSIDHEGNDFKTIVYEYMINGSLENWLHNNHSAKSDENHVPKNLNLLQRVNITIDVANALDYLHNHLETPLVHCDLKPSNILLDSELVAHVGDFGLAEFLPIDPTPASSSDQMSSVGIKGTIGYTAPEYGMGSGAWSIFGYVYSFGILLLEIFTGKNPTSDIFVNDLTLHDYVKMVTSEQVITIIDPKLFHKVEATPTNLVRRERILECLISIFKIGIACSMESTRERMNINSAIKQLYSIKDALMKLGDFETIPCSNSCLLSSSRCNV